MEQQLTEMSAAGFRVSVYMWPNPYGDDIDLHVKVEGKTPEGDSLIIERQFSSKDWTISEVVNVVYDQFRRITARVPEFNLNRTLPAPVNLDDGLPF